MQAIDRVNGKICEQTFTNHFAATALVFFCWLKDEMHCAIKFELTDCFRGGKSHCYMPVMPTGVHLSCRLRSVGHAAFLDNGQCIHISTDTNGALGCTTRQTTNDTRSGKARPDGKAPLHELFGNEPGCTIFLKTQFRMAV
ncbi:hypothetical protein D3C80_1552080 [compost metagenome]